MKIVDKTRARKRILPRFKKLVEYISYSSNFWDVVLLYFRLKKRIKLKLRGFSAMELERQHLDRALNIIRALRSGLLECDGDYFIHGNIKVHKNNLIAASSVAKALLSGFSLKKVRNGFRCKIPYKGYRVVMDLSELSQLDILHSIFVQGEYDVFDFKDKIVLDIGGFIGDTAIFFALNGAKRVHVFEPNPFLYKLCKKNVKRNKFNHRVKVHPYGVSDKCGKIVLNVYDSAGGTGSVYRRKNIPYIMVNARVVSISKVLEKEEVFDIVKMDCEGCEYSILWEIAKRNFFAKIREGFVFELHRISEYGGLEEFMNILERMPEDWNVEILSHAFSEKEDADVWLIKMEKMKTSAIE